MKNKWKVCIATALAITSAAVCANVKAMAEEKKDMIEFRDMVYKEVIAMSNKDGKESTSKVMTTLCKLIEKQVENSTLTNLNDEKIEKIVYSLLSSPTNFTPLLHYVTVIYYTFGNTPCQKLYISCVIQFMFFSAIADKTDLNQHSGRTQIPQYHKICPFHSAITGTGAGEYSALDTVRQRQIVGIKTVAFL